METIATTLAGTVIALLLTVGIGKADCIAECISTGGGMQCTSCDAPKDGEVR